MISRAGGKIFVVFSVLIAGAVLGSCSLAKIGLKFGDHLIVRQIDQYFGLDGDDRVFVKERVAAHWAWARSDLMPRISPVMDELVGRLKDGLQTVDLVWAEKHILEWRKEVLDRVASDGSRFICQLSDKQMQHFTKKLEDNNSNAIENIADMKEDIADGEKPEPHVRWKSIEHWTGSLTAEQKKILTPWYGNDLAELEFQLTKRRANQSTVIEKIQAARSQKSCDKFWAEMTQHVDYFYGPNAPESFAQVQIRRRERLIKVFDTLNAQQKSHVSARIHEWSEIIGDAALPSAH